MIKLRAFTLIELLISLSLLAILLFFTIPFESSLHQKNQIQVIQEEIKSAVRYAKTQALISGNTLILTPSNDSNDWSDGMRLFKDNAKHQYTSKDAVIHAWHWNSSGIQVTWRGFQSNHYLLFSTDVSKNAVNGSFLIESNAKYAAKLVINKLGRVKHDDSHLN